VTRAVVIVNPAAGGGRTGRRWPAIRDDLTRRGLAFEWIATAAGGDGTRLAREAAAAGAPLVVAVGGDGTLNEVVDGVAGDGGSRATVGAILTGRGRDAASNLGLATDAGVAARRLVEGEDVRLDLVAARWPDGTDRVVINAAGAGFDARVARRTARRGGRSGVPYFLGVVTTLTAHETVPAEIETDTRAWSGRLSAVVIANGAHYGGGMKIAPAASAADGLLDVVVLGDLGRLELLRWLPTVYHGGHLANPRVVTWTARRVAIRAARPLPVHVDGEPAADTPLAFEIRPGALRLRR
jgi:YegS/Rv2252/BmrU family lipid kinase